MKRILTGPYWVTVDEELRLQLRPVASDLIVEAMRPVLELQRSPADPEAAARLKAGTATADEVVAAVTASREMVLRLMELLVVDWTVADEGGAKLTPTTAHFEALFGSEPGLLEKLMAVLVEPLTRQMAAVSAEKNGSGPSPNGSSAEGPNTATHAGAPAPSAPAA